VGASALSLDSPDGVCVVSEGVVEPVSLPPEGLCASEGELAASRPEEALSLPAGPASRAARAAIVPSEPAPEVEVPEPSAVPGVVLLVELAAGPEPAAKPPAAGCSGTRTSM
jgi:hypothetical protein